MRKRFHPMWRLRRLRAFRWLQNRCDVAVARRDGRVVTHVYFLRDMEQWLAPRMKEQKTADAFRAVLDRFNPACFVDVGANMGAYSWLVANRWPQAELLLFEPDVKNQHLLRRTIARSRLLRATLHPVALSDREGTTRFIVDDASGAVGSIVDQRGGFHNLQDAYKLSREVEVTTRRLDEFLPQLAGRAVLLKIDVEGAEDLVFRGAARVLADVRPVVFCECFAPERLELFRGLDYRIFSLEEDSNYLIVPRAICERLVAGLALREVV